MWIQIRSILITATTCSPSTPTTKQSYFFTELPGTNFLIPNPPDAIAVNTVISARQTKAVKIFRTAQMRKELVERGTCRDLLQQATTEITNGWIAAPRHVAGLQEGSSWEQVPPAPPLRGQEEAWGILHQNLGRLTPTGHGFSISCPQLAAIFSLPASVSVKFVLLVALILANPTFQPAMAATLPLQAPSSQRFAGRPEPEFTWNPYADQHSEQWQVQNSSMQILFGEALVLSITEHHTNRDVVRIDRTLDLKDMAKTRRNAKIRLERVDTPAKFAQPDDGFSTIREDSASEYMIIPEQLEMQQCHSLSLA